MDFYKIIVDASTGERTEVPLTQEEIDAKAERIANIEAEALAAEEAAARRAEIRESARAKLSALGLTDEEVIAIIGA